VRLFFLSFLFPFFFLFFPLFPSSDADGRVGELVGREERFFPLFIFFFFFFLFFSFFPAGAPRSRSPHRPEAVIGERVDFFPSSPLFLLPLFLLYLQLSCHAGKVASQSDRGRFSHLPFFSPLLFFLLLLVSRRFSKDG